MPDAERIGTHEAIGISWIMSVVPEPGQTFSDERRVWTVLAAVEQHPGITKVAVRYHRILVTGLIYRSLADVPHG